MLHGHRSTNNDGVLLYYNTNNSKNGHLLFRKTARTKNNLTHLLNYGSTINFFISAIYFKMLP
jgi:hypothetical protein